MNHSGEEKNSYFLHSKSFLSELIYFIGEGKKNQ